MQESNSKHSKTTYVDNNGIIHLSDQDASVALIKTADVYCQRIAIARVLRMITESKIDHNNLINELKTTLKNEKKITATIIESELVDAYHLSVYFDAANSMSALGMLAPTIESILYDIFINIGEGIGTAALTPESDRLKAKKKEQIWDCHYKIGNKDGQKDLKSGIAQLVFDTGFIKYLSKDFLLVLNALLTYRNKMFHNGLEWPQKEIEIFRNNINDKGWPLDWFTCSKSNGYPWIYYMSELFQKRCVDLIDEIEKGIGKYYIDKNVI